MNRPEDMLRILNNKKIRRCQPAAGHKEQILSILSRCGAEDAPLPFLIRWAKSFEGDEEAEDIAIDFLAAPLRQVAQMHAPGLRLNVLFVDTHVAFNGCSATMDDAERLRRRFLRPFTGCGNVTASVGLLSECLGFTPLENGGFKEFEDLVARAAPDRIPESTLATLIDRGAKYCRRRDLCPEVCAAAYDALCRIDMEGLGERFGGNIFLSYNHARQNGRMPPGLPVLHLWSLWHGVTEKPWNVSAARLAQLKRMYGKEGAYPILNDAGAGASIRIAA